MGTPEQITPQTVAGLPDQPLEEGVNGLPELSAYVAITSLKKAADQNSTAQGGNDVTENHKIL